MKGFVRKSWWLGIVLLLCGGYYYHSLCPKEVEIHALKYKMQEMEKEKDLSLHERDELKARIRSHDDPAWVEEILMKELGVVPEGYVKVHFQKPNKE